MYVFDAAVLRDGLARLDRANAQGEVYLTDVIAGARADGGATRAILADDPFVAEGVNDRLQLSRLAAEFNRRTLEDAMADGVGVLDPSSTWIDVEVELEPDVALLPGTHLKPGCAIRSGAVIGPFTTLEDTEVGVGATVDRTVARGAVIGAGASVGPFTYLRPGTELGAGAKAGAYVEIKNSAIGENAKVPHLSYVGDATIGEGTNIGAATIVANYDGVAKARTVVGPHAKIGADTVLVAPVEVGAGAYTGAGAVIRRNVPPGALAVTEARQRVYPGWVQGKRGDTSAAQSAASALGETAPTQTPAGPHPGQASSPNTSTAHAQQ
jgi:bifunctional UDP-N-acetylglucosamine pyrophosphorylase/glucosamine-1-phosphate N-acetyltransferase